MWLSLPYLRVRTVSTAFYLLICAIACNGATANPAQPERSPYERRGDIFDILEAQDKAKKTAPQGDVFDQVIREDEAKKTAPEGGIVILVVGFVLFVCFAAVAVRRHRAEKAAVQPQEAPPKSTRGNPRAVLVFTVLLLLASWTYPPWIHFLRRPGYQRPQVPNGWFYVFDAEQGEPANLRSQLVMQIDFGRLILIDMVIVAGGALLFFTASRKSGSR
jgi:hypothetical protein